MDSGASGVRVLPVTLLGSTFTRRDAISAVARAFDVTPDEAAALTARFLEREGVVRVLADPDAGTEHIRTRSGHVVPATSGDRRYTTTELLAAEQRIIDSASARIGEGTGRVAPDMVERVLRLHPHLDVEQADGVRALLSSGNGYDLVIGQAGTGKTTLLGATRIGWEEAGFRVIGTAVAARTAADLEAGTGIPSSSLTQLLADLRESGGLTTRHVIVLDEASMVGSRPLDQLRSYVDAAGAKLVLLGDNRQLSSIDAGGALRSLSSELGSHVVTLTTNRRQAGSDQQWERDALVALRHGDVTPAVDAYVEHGRVTITGTIDAGPPAHRGGLVERPSRPTPPPSWPSADPMSPRSTRWSGPAVRPPASWGPRSGSAPRRSASVTGSSSRRTSGCAQQTPLTPVANPSWSGSATARSAPWWRSPTTLATLRPGRVTFAEPKVTLPAASRKPAPNRRARWSSSSTTGAAPSSPAATPRPPRAWATRSPCSAPRGSRSTTPSGSVATASTKKPATPQLSRGRLSNNLYVAAPENPRWEIGHHADDLAQRDALESLVGALSQNKEQTMARDRLPTWPPVSADDFASAYREHASLGHWIADHAPPDVARQLADAYLRRLEGSGDEQARTGAEGDVTTLVAAQRRRDAWASGHQAEIERWSQLDRGLRRHEYRLGQAAAYSRPDHTAAVLGPLPDRISGVERWQSAAGAIEAYRIPLERHSPRTRSALNPSTPSSVLTGREQ